MSCGNFLELAQTQCGIAVGFGKMILIYADAGDIPYADLTATAIQADIADGTIIGIIQGWNTVAPASVAEVNAARVTGKIKKVKSEILGDTFTFDDNTVNQDVLERLSGETLNCLVVDDMGYVFGDQTLTAENIHTVEINFSNKASNGLQNDLTNEKTVAITALYFFDKIGYYEADIEVEEIVAKVALFAKVSSITSQVSPTIVFVLDLFNEETGALLTALAGDIDVTAIVNGNAVTAAGVFATNQLTVTLTETVGTFDATTNKIKLSISNASYYLTEITFNTGDFTA